MTDLPVTDKDRVLHPREHAILDMAYRCRHCGQMFKALHNFGTWRCLCHHGEVVAGRYTCCQQGVGSRGCVPCDHWITKESPLGTVHKIRPALLEYMLRVHVRLNPSSWSESGNEVVIVRRSKATD
jgi:hypothetical protein